MRDNGVINSYTINLSCNCACTLMKQRWHVKESKLPFHDVCRFSWLWEWAHGGTCFINTATVIRCPQEPSYIPTVSSWCNRVLNQHVNRLLYFSGKHCTNVRVQEQEYLCHYLLAWQECQSTWLCSWVLTGWQKQPKRTSIKIKSVDSNN